MRATLAGLLIVVVVAAEACGAGSTSPTTPASEPTGLATQGSGHGEPTAGPPTVPPSAAASRSSAIPSPALTGRWELTGTLGLGRADPHAVLLDDDRVLVVGSTDAFGECVPPDSRQSEIWDPTTGTWSSGASLDGARAAFAAAGLPDGRVLVAGGVDAGTMEDGWQWQHRSYASTAVYDVRRSGEGWTPAGSLGAPRTSPGVATLRDGRILIVGGYDLGQAQHRAGDAAPSLVNPRVSPNAVLADYQPQPDLVPALATAELFDPASGTWSATGPMRYARVDPAVATLSDGRVLVAGSWYGGSNQTSILGDDQATTTAEIYDPGTGRFTLVGDPPPVDWSPLAEYGYALPTDSGRSDLNGTLVSLPDGGALLVGASNGLVSFEGADGQEKDALSIDTLRYDPRSGQWTDVDRQLLIAEATENGDVGEWTRVILGHAWPGALAASLGDGRVLVAGGAESAGDDPSRPVRQAALYDARTGTWASLPLMPLARVGGAAVTLSDGSVLLIGGRGGGEDMPACDRPGPTGLAATVRFLPGH